MAHCKKCGSFAINHGSHGRDGSEPDLCDVCYWRKRADVMAALIRELVSVITHDGETKAEFVARVRAILGADPNARKTPNVELTGAARHGQE